MTAAVLAIAAICALTIWKTMPAWHPAHPNHLTDPSRVCDMRGHHVDQDQPGTDFKECQQCHLVRRRDTCNVGLCDRVATHVNPNHPNGPFYICGKHGTDTRRWVA